MLVCHYDHIELECHCHTCNSSVELHPSSAVLQTGMYGVVTLQSYMCSNCDTSLDLALKITANKTRSDSERNEHELGMWSRLLHIPGIVPLLSSKTVGEYWLFIMPKMKPLASLMSTTLTLALKLRIIRRLCDILSAISSMGLVYPDGGCKQLLMKDNDVYLCDFGAVQEGGEAQSIESLRIVIWELRVMFKGNAEKLKTLEELCQTSGVTFACIREEISRLAGNY